MLAYVIRRLILVVPVLLGVMTILFVLVNSLPVETQLIDHFGTPPPRAPWVYSPTVPCSYLGVKTNGTCANPVYDHDIAVLGLNQPVPYRWALYMYDGFTFHWGEVSTGSLVGQNYKWASGQNVTSVLSWLLPYTIELAAISLIIILVVSIPLGNLSAANRNRPIDQASRVMSFSGYALPAFLLGSLVLAAVFLMVGAWTGSYAAHPSWCPTGESLYSEIWGSWPGAYCIPGSNSNTGYPNWLTNGIQSTPTGFPTIDALYHGQVLLGLDTIIRMILPALVIAFGTVAALLRFVRNSMLEVMNLDFIRTARAKGVPERTVVNRHAGRNSMNVTITVLGLTFAGFIGGFPVIEYVFNLNGVGEILALSIQPPEDFALIFGSTLLFTFLVVGANIIVDVLYAYLDPRVRLG